MWTVQFGAEANQASKVRHGAEGFLRGQGVTDQIDTITLLLSELVTNAMRYAVAPRRATVSIEAKTVRVTVDDATSQPPRVLPTDLMRPGGNGMRIVSSLATTWGVQGKLVGKSVWFTVPR